MSNEPKAGMNLDPEMIAAYIDKRLTPEQRAAVEAELAKDPDSYAVLVESMKALDELAVPGVRTVPFVPKGKVPTVRRWTIAAGVLAAAAAIVLVVVQPQWLQRLRGDRVDPRVEQLVAAVGAERYIEARLTGGFAHGDLQAVSRGTAPKATDNLSLMASAGRAQAEAKRDPSARQAYAVSLVLLGRTDEAVLLLEALAAEKPSADLLSDLAAAYLSRTSPIDHPDDVAKALAAAERATELNSKLPEAWFNLAIALERLQLRDQAIEAWTKCVSLESGAWRAEAEGRLALLQKVSSLGESTAPQPSTIEDARDSPELVEGRRLLVEGKSLYRRYLFAQALLPLQSASKIFHRLDSPLRLDADANLGTVYYHLRDVGTAEPLLRGTAAEALKERHYAVAAQANMALGILVGGQGRLGEALEYYREGADAARSAGDDATTRYASNLTAEVLHLIGDYSKAWREVNVALPLLSREPDYRRRLSVAFVASAVSLKSGETRAARRFQRSFIETANRASVPVSAVEGLIARAKSSTSLGETDLARVDLETAAARINAHADLTYDKFLRGELQSALSELYAAADPQAALTEVAGAINYMMDAHRREKLPKLYLLQGRLNRQLGDLDGARTSLAAGFAALRQHVSAMRATTLSLARVESASDLVSEWIDFQVSVDHQDAAALSSLEELWCLTWTSQCHVGLDEARSQLAPGVVFVYYVPAASGVLMWTVTRDGIKHYVVHATSKELESAVAAIESDVGDYPALKTIGQQLLSPIEAVLKRASVMVVCPVGVMSRIPWPLVTSPWSGKPLVADVAIALSPGLSVTRAMAQAHRLDGGNPATLLIGGSPAPGVSAMLGLQSLAGARDELQLLHRQVTNSTLVTEVDATPEAFKRLAPQFGVVHFAGHALYREAAPDESSLVLRGATPLTSTLTAREIGALNFSKTRAVILAACDTVGGRTSGTEGPLGIGKAFLVAGAGLVVGTRWSVPDSASMPLMLKMHRHAATTGDYVSALRLATIECLTEGGECGARRTWGAYVAIGSSPAWFSRSSTNRS